MAKRFTDKGPSPIALAKAMTPFWFQTIHSNDGLELAPVAEYADKDGSIFCERVDDLQDAQFWSVYGHRRPEGGVECLEDFDTEQEVSDFADWLLGLFILRLPGWIISMIAAVSM